MTPVTVTVDGANVHRLLEDLERRARDHETQAGQCREAAATIRRLYDVSTIVPAAMGGREAPPRRRMSPPTPSTPMRTAGSSNPAPHPQWTEKAQAAREQILAAMRRFNTPVRMGELWQAVEGRVPHTRLKAIMRRLTDDGVLTCTGYKSTTTYELATATTADAPANPPLVTPAPAKASVASAPTPEHSKAKVTFFLLNQVDWATPLHSGDLTLLVHDKFGSAPFTQLDELLGELVVQGELERTGDPGTYRRVLARPREAVEASPQLLDALERILKTGASYDTRELVRNLRSHHVEIPEPALREILDQLKADRRLERIGLGSTWRYRKIDKVSLRGKARAS